MKINKIDDGSLKKSIANKVLNALPEWFGIPSSTVEYIEKSANMPFWAVLDGEEDLPVGFIAIKETSSATAEIYVMGIHKEYHKKGYGMALVKAAEKWCIESGYKFLQVKTLDKSHPDLFYAKTRKFYEACGFMELECIKEIWGEGCPCLILVKNI